MKNSFKGTNFLINIYKPLGMFRLPRQKTKKIMKHNKPTRQVSMRMFLTLVLIMMSSAFVMAQENYGFKVAGVDVTSDNYLNLTEISGVSGKVYFDPNTRTLTLDNATIEANDCNAILNETCDNLLIKLLGTNTINVTNSAGIYTRESTVILGDGGAKLSVKSDLCALLFGGCPLEINNCWLEAEGKWGISASYNEAEEVLTIRNSHVEAKGTSGSICDIAGLKLDGCHIDIPSKAAYDADKKAVALNGETVKEKVVIEPNSYGINIADKPVTTLNYKDLTSIYGVSGSASYDPETKTLTLDNATIERNSTDGTGIVNKTVSDFTVKLIGKNTVTADLASMVLNQTSTITGDGSLHLTSKRFCGLDMEGASVTIDNTSLFVKGGYGIAGFIGAESEVLTVRNSYVEAEGSGSGSITLISNLILDNCAITQPVGAEFDADQKAVVLNGEVFKSKVVIEPDNNSIGTITADVPARKQGIYNLNGVKLTQQWDDLPAGIYIVDGVKRVKN